MGCNAGLCSALQRMPPEVLDAHSNDPAQSHPSSSTPPRDPPGRSMCTAPTTPVFIQPTVENTARGTWVSRSWRRQRFREFLSRWAWNPTPSASVTTARSSEHRWADVFIPIEPLRLHYHNYSMMNLSPLPEPLPRLRVRERGSVQTGSSTRVRQERPPGMGGGGGHTLLGNSLPSHRGLRDE